EAGRRCRARHAFSRPSPRQDRRAVRAGASFDGLALSAAARGLPARARVLLCDAAESAAAPDGPRRRAPPRYRAPGVSGGSMGSYTPFAHSHQTKEAPGGPGASFIWGKRVAAPRLPANHRVAHAAEAVGRDVARMPGVSEAEVRGGIAG